MWSRQGTQSALISAGVNLGQTALFAVCVGLSMSGETLTAMRWVLGMGSCAVTFVMHREMVFSGSSDNARLEALRYGATSVLSVTVATYLYAWMTMMWPVADPTLLQLISMVVVWPVLTYPLMKRWVFGDKSRLTAA